MSCASSGLRDEVRLPVRMLNPPTSNDAFGLAIIQEQYVWSTKKPWKRGFAESAQLGSGSGGVKPNPTGSILGIPKTQLLAKFPHQKLSEAQM